MSEFNPPFLLKNRHIQSIFSSTGPRKWLLQSRARTLLHHAKKTLLNGGNGVRLEGAYSAQPKHSKGLVLMIHGWEGCINSSYLLSAGSALYAQGYSIFRLNLRDHGDTHHLNKGLFNSTRLNEVIEAVKHVQQLFPHSNNYLAGFSLGGNFVLRIAAKAPTHGIHLNKVAAVCPVINPLNTMRDLEEGWFVYHDYFRRKWSRSLSKKLSHFPELGYADKLLKLKTLSQMNDYFVPNHTDYDDTQSYLLGYAITGNVLAQLCVPCHIISAKDDPVIQVEDLSELADSHFLTIEVTQYGGHCGYLKNYKLHSWIDNRLVTMFANS
jgi:uncharacterized protein